MIETIILAVSVVILVALMVVSYMKKKKYNTGLSDMRDQLNMGDKVMTESGIVGELVDSYEEDGFKYFVLKSGRGQNVGFYTVHANAIYYVFGKEDQPIVAHPKTQTNEDSAEKSQKEESAPKKKSSNKKTSK